MGYVAYWKIIVDHRQAARWLVILPTSVGPSKGSVGTMINVRVRELCNKKS